MNRYYGETDYDPRDDDAALYDFDCYHAQLQEQERLEAEAAFYDDPLELCTPHPDASDRLADCPTYYC